MLKTIALAAALIAPACVQANEISEYIQQEVSGVYTVYIPGLVRPPAPMRFDYADGDQLAIEQGGTQNLMPIHSLDTTQDTVNLLDASGNLVTLSVRFGQGTMTMADGSKWGLSFVRKLTDIDYAAMGRVIAPTSSLAQAPIQQQAAPAASPQIKASFDCTKAFTAVEGMICGDAELASLDLRTATAYKAARDGAENRSAMQKEQVEWLKLTRNVCKTPECLFQAYTERAQDLEQLAQYLSKPAEFR